jgi:Tol biopolymer transport system component
VEIYVEEVETGFLLPLASNAIDPVWSPDGRWLAYSAMDEHGQIDLWIAQFDGSERRRLTDTSEVEKGLAWLPKP